MSRRTSRFLLLAAFASLLSLPARAVEVSGKFKEAVWNWWNFDIYWFEERPYRALVAPTLKNGNFYLEYTNVSWSQGWDDQAVQGDGRYGDNFSGVIYAAFNHYTKPHIVAKRRVLSATFVNGRLVAAIEGRLVANTGRWAVHRIRLQGDRRDKAGGPVELSTGGESFTRPLFDFNGARPWGFALSYNSIFAADQTTPDELGFGWSHPFMTRVRTSGADLVVDWSATRTNTFTPKPGEAGTFVSSEDATRFDTLVARTGGGWQLTRRDQSALIFNTSGRLIEDRDRHGRRLTLTYASNRLTRVAEPVSNTSLDFGYDGNGRLATLTDATGAAVSLSYTSNLLTRLTDQNGRNVDYTYNATRGLLTLKDHNGVVLTSNTYDTDGRVIAQEDGVPGNPLTFSYEEYGLPGNPIRELHAGVAAVNVVRPDGWCMVERTVDLNGVVTTYGYSQPSALPFWERLWLNFGHPDTPPVEVNYDAAGNIVSFTPQGSPPTPLDPKIVTTVTDRTGRVSTYTFNDDCRLRSVRNALNETTSYTYDAQGNTLSITDPLNRTTSFTYDVRGNVLTRIDPASKVTAFTYDARNNLLTTTDADNKVTTRTYDAANNLLTLTDALGRTTTWTYNADAQPLTMTLPGGGVSTYTYTAGRLTQLTDPNGVVTKFGYDANGRLLYREDATGRRVTHTYDPAGNLLTLANGLNQATTYTYDHRNRASSITDPLNAVTRYTYDHNNNVLTVTDPLNKVTTFTYDGEDRLRTITDATNRTTTFAYDAAGRRSSATNGASQTTSFDYNAAGDLIAVQDPLGRRTISTYDPRGLPLTATDPLSRVTTFTYDDLGRRVTARDGLNRTTAFAYDALHRLTGTTDPGGLTASQGFDANGRRTSLSNPATHATRFTFDAGGRLTASITPEGRSTGLTYDARDLVATITEPSTQVTTLAYDAAHRLASFTDGSGTVSFTHDAAGRLLAVAEGTRTLTREYDLAGRMTKFTDGDGNVLRYAYDDAGRLLRLTYPDLKEVAYAYDAAGRLRTVTDWANRTTTYTYDGAGRLTETLRPNGTRQSRLYDAAGQLTQLRELAPDGTTVLHAADAITYDLAGRLTRETLTPAVAPATYAATQTYDRDNRLLTHNGAATTFDADGNLLSIAAGLTPSSYSYDTRNRLASAGGLSYVYDAEKRRVGVGDSSGLTRFVVNPNPLLDQVVVRTTPDGTKTFYVHGLGLLHEETGSVVRYYHHDRRGDTVVLTDASGAVTDRIAYGIYGEITARSGTTNTPFLFNGRWGVQTDGNGLYFHRARYYHPQLRRFLNQDVVLGAITDAASLNRFAYANGCPLSLVDPFGLAAQSVLAELGRYMLSREYWTAVLDNIQTELDLIGLVPGFGEVADGINGVIYLARGDYTSAALSAAAMIPIGGQAATATKLGLKYGDELGAVVKQIEKAAEKLPPTIIGETMTRVEQAAAKIPGAKILDDMPDFKAMGMAPHEVTNAMMAHNRKWILNELRSGRTILDIGVDPTRKIPSIFYQMEQNMIRNYQKLHPRWDAVSRTSGVPQ